ncbi:MAG: divalent-cation tolerance protein CutA, partial [Limisphaerales bacterium]
MKSTQRHCAVWVTVPDRATGRRIAKLVLAAKAAACVSIVPGLESHYWWKGRQEKGRELLLVIKTTLGRLKNLELLVKESQPYETPEFDVVPFQAGSERYLAWIDE